MGEKHWILWWMENGSRVEKDVTAPNRTAAIAEAHPTDPNAIVHVLENVHWMNRPIRKGNHSES